LSTARRLPAAAQVVAAEPSQGGHLDGVRTSIPAARVQVSVVLNKN
jgi:hypothetical protein